MEFENKSYVEIDSDQMQAWIYLTPPKDGVVYTEETIYQYLKANKIVYGLHKSNIKAIIKKKIYLKPVLVARGDRTTPTKPGYYEFHVTPVQFSSPKILSNGNVDYSLMTPLPNIEIGDKIATYFPSVRGKSGISVLGLTIAAEKEKELKPLEGCVVRKIEDNVKVYYASHFGKINIKDGVVDIGPQHEIFGNVTLVDGVIEFAGDIVVYGNVETGSVLKAARHIIVHGVTEGATIEAGGDIILAKGVNGGQKATLISKNNVFADFIEYADIKAAEDICANVIMNSNVSANGSVTLTGKDGYIIGGTTHGYKGITAAQLGNAKEIATQVHIGYSESVFRENMMIKRKVEKARVALEKAKVNLVKLLQQCKSNPKAATMLKDNLQAAVEEKAKKEEACLALEKRQLELSEEIRNGQDGQIRCAGRIYRGVTIGVGKEKLIVTRSTSFMIYKNHQGQISSEVMVY